MSLTRPLRLVNAGVFAEADIEGEKRDKPLEWRRGFNPISFKAVDVAVLHAYTVNEVEGLPAGVSDVEDESQKIGAQLARKRRLTFRVEQETLRDRLFMAVDDKATGTYRLERIVGDFEVSIVEAKPVAAGAKGRDEGSYDGSAFLDDRGDKKCLVIEVNAPGEQFDEIVPLLQSGHVNTLHATVDLHSFSFEVDDALREWYHPRELFIHPDFVRASLRSMAWSKSEGMAATAADEELAREEPVESRVAVTPQAHTTVDYSQVLKGIRTALWVIAGLLLVIAVNRP